MPGIEARAPERTETSSGFFGSPKRFAITRSILPSAASDIALHGLGELAARRVDTPRTPPSRS